MATDVEKETAVAKLTAAGTDLGLLAQALQEAKFLEGIPGDHRQKFRGTPWHCTLKYSVFSGESTIS